MPELLGGLTHIGVVLLVKFVQQAGQIKRLGILGHKLGILISGERRPVIVGQLRPNDLLNFVHERSEGCRDLCVAFALDLLQLLLEDLALIVGQAHASAEFLGVDHDPFDPRRHLKRVVLNVLTSPSKNGMQQFLFWRQLGLTLGRDLADQNVARINLGTNMDNATLIQIAQGLFRHIGNVASELLSAEFCFANFHIKVFDVDGRISIRPHQFLADDNRIFVVVSVE